MVTLLYAEQDTTAEDRAVRSASNNDEPDEKEAHEKEALPVVTKKAKQVHAPWWHSCARRQSRQ